MPNRFKETWLPRIIRPKPDTMLKTPVLVYLDRTRVRFWYDPLPSDALFTTRDGLSRRGGR